MSWDWGWDGWNAIEAIGTASAFIAAAIAVIFSVAHHKAERERAEAAELRLSLNVVAKRATELGSLATDGFALVDCSRDIVEALSKRLPGSTTLSDVLVELRTHFVLARVVALDAGVGAAYMRRVDTAIAEVAHADLAMKGGLAVVSEPVKFLGSTVARFHTIKGVWRVLTRETDVELAEDEHDLALEDGQFQLESYVARWISNESLIIDNTVRELVAFIDSACRIFLGLSDRQLVAASYRRTILAAESSMESYAQVMPAQLEELRGILSDGARRELSDRMDKIVQSAPFPPRMSAPADDQDALELLTTFPAAEEAHQALERLRELGEEELVALRELANDEMLMRAPDAAFAPGLYVPEAIAQGLEESGLVVEYAPRKLDAAGDRLMQLSDLGRRTARLITASGDPPEPLRHEEIPGRTIETAAGDPASDDRPRGTPEAA